MSSESKIQMLQLQEQLNYQNKAIEKLQKLVISQNNERAFFKEQISDLKDELKRLAGKMKSQETATNPERQILALKRELKNEIEKLKATCLTHDREINKGGSLSSLPLSDDIWRIKENVTESLEQVHRDIGLINKRIDRVESEVLLETYEKPRSFSSSTNVHGSGQTKRLSALYTPMYKGNNEINSLEVQLLRQSVSSLNSKLDNLERKVTCAYPQQPIVYPQSWAGQSRDCYAPTSFITSALDVREENVNSLSDLSDISGLSGNISDDSIDAFTPQLRDGTSSKHKTRRRRSSYKTDKSRRGKVEFSLTDSDDLDNDSL